MSQPITMRDLITNPPGKNTHHVGARYMIRDAITAKYRETMLDPLRRKRYKLSVSKIDESTYLIWVKIPSEKYAVDYDVIFQLSFPDGVRSVMNADVQLYCNSPGWFMPVGYVAATTGLLIPAWKKALGQAATTPPDAINPNQDYGYDKTTFRAILFVTGIGGIVSLSDLEVSASGKAPNPADLSLSAQSKLLEYRRAKEKFDLAARIVKRAEKRTKEEAEKKVKTTARAAKGTAKLAKTISTAKKARQASNAVGKKSRSSK